MGSILSIDDRLGIIEKWNPRKAEQLRLAWLLENEDGKKDVRWYIDNIAEMILLEPKYKNSAFLSVPPEETAVNGDIEIGDVMKGKATLYPLKLKKHSLLKHVGLFGSTGSGKTNSLYGMIKSMSENDIPILVFDFSKRNYRDLMETKLKNKINVFTVGKNTTPFRFNPLIPPEKILPSVWAKRFAEVFDHAYFLLGGGRHIVLKALDDLYAKHGVYSNSGRYPTIPEVRDWVAGYESKKLSFRERNWVSTAKRALDSLCSKETGDMFVREGIKPCQLLNGITVLELDSLNEDNRVFFIEILLQWLRDWLLENWKKEELAGVIILEEAHYVLNREKSKRIGSETVMDLLFREIRELGMGIIYADQHPSKVSYSALGNTNVQIYMRLNMDSKYDSDVVDASKMLGLKGDEIDYIRNLGVGQGIIRSGTFHKPFLLGFPRMPVEKGKVTDEKIRHLMKDKLKTFYGDKTVFHDGKMINETKDVELGGMEFRIIKALGSGEAVSRTELMHNLNTSSKILGGRMGVLINKGHVRYRMAKVYRNKVCYYYLTEKGVNLFRCLTGRGEAKPKKSENLHKQIKNLVIEKYVKEGFTVGNSNVGTGNVDVVLEKDGKTAKIEIETGANSNDWLYRNIEKCAAVAGSTYFLCADKKVRNRVLQQAARHSLYVNREFIISVLTFQQLKEGSKWEQIRFEERTDKK